MFSHVKGTFKLWRQCTEYFIIIHIIILLYYIQSQKTNTGLIRFLEKHIYFKNILELISEFNLTLLMLYFFLEWKKRVVAMWFLANCIMHMPLETSTKKEHLNNKIVYKYRLLLTSGTCSWNDVWQSSAKYMLPLLKKHFGKDLV